MRNAPLHTEENGLAGWLGATPDADNDDLGYDWDYGYDWEWDYCYYDEPEPEPDYPDDEPEAPVYDYTPDEWEHLPFTGKVSMTAALRYTMDKACPYGCCRDRRLRHRRPKFNVKPKRKDHRS
jgi:hypothetical protein